MIVPEQLDTAGQNRLNIETDRILYNTIISHAALNMDWLATAEVLDDQVHTHESRLKFWHFDAEKQIYALNTQVELPHENGVRALQFSTPYSIDNLLCASSGELDVKVWTLEDMERVDSEYPIERPLSCQIKTNSIDSFRSKRQNMDLYRSHQLQRFGNQIVGILFGHVIAGDWLWQHVVRVCVGNTSIEMCTQCTAIVGR